jgi:hypothetical protein
VHALRHAHRLLVPRGALVDLHPVSEEEVEAGGRLLGVIREEQFIGVDLPNAEAGVREMVGDGLFALEAEEKFDFLHHFDEADEVLDAREGELAEQPELVSRIRAAAPPFRLRAHVVLRRLRKREHSV